MTELQLSREAISALRSADEPRTQFVLGSIKAAIACTDEMRQGLINIGIVLKAGYITPQQALDWAEAIAPGFVGYVPPLSGLGITRNEGDSEPAKSEDA
jgi:hypothetical protein